MKKKGFTIAETVGVIVILASILLIMIPLVERTLKGGKQKLLDEQINILKSNLAIWANENKPKTNETYLLTLSQLKQSSLAEHDLKNPITGEYFPNDMLLKVINQNDVLTYEILLDTGSCKSDYKDTPKIENDNIVFTEINSNYVDVKAVAKDIYGNVLNNLTSSGTVDTKKLGNYTITYNIYKDGKCNSSIKNVIVVDTTAPVISFKTTELVINLSEVNTYDFLNDVTVTDNSGENIEVLVEKEFTAIRGDYSIKYIAKDSSGNISTKLRKVTVK